MRAGERKKRREKRREGREREGGEERRGEARGVLGCLVLKPLNVWGCAVRGLVQALGDEGLHLAGHIHPMAKGEEDQSLLRAEHRHP